MVGFQFDQPDGSGKIATVVLRDGLAEAFAQKAGDTPKALDGLAVRVTGTLWADPWKKDGEAMPPSRRIEAQALAAAGWALPAREAAAPPKSGKPPKQTTVAEATHEARKAGEASGPGMSLATFLKALDAGRVARTYAAAQGEETYGAKNLDDLTDQQRLELAGELGVLATDEEG